MTYVSAAVLVADTKKAAVEAASLLLTPTFDLAFARKVCADDPPATWESAGTHWYTNVGSVDQNFAVIWQAAAAGTLPEGFSVDPEAGMTAQDILGAFAGASVWIGYNVGDAIEWAAANLGPLGLMIIPEPPL